MPTTTQIGSIQQTIPPELLPYFTNAAGDSGILPTAQKYTARSYNDVYGGLESAGTNGTSLAGANRIASLSPMQTQVGNEVQNLGLPSEFGSASNTFGNATDTLNSAGNVYNGMTDANQVSKFMNPYTALALDPQIQAATRNAQINSVNQDRGAARAGSYGGARNILAQQEANKNLQTQLGNITAQGYNTAFDTAMKNQIAQGQGLTAVGQGQTQTAAGLGALAQAENTSNIANISTQGAYGDLQRAVQQQQLDAQYSDAMRRADFPMEQVGNMANLLRGVPIAQTGGATTTNTPAPSFASQIAGLGLGGLGLMKQLG
jgi:hypothetical protein